ncbi:MAG: hypothetical protein MUF15_21930, partial [Acidobacteria bacterium]|nr:hypothetical protein [Acidobacteriota bacterium]
MERKSYFPLFIIALVITGITSLVGEDDLYTSICTQGYNGYKIFLSNYNGNSKKEFWIDFCELILNFKQKKQFENILNCFEFWKELKHDALFDFDDVARSDKREIEKIFIDAQDEYKKNLVAAMNELKPLNGMYSPATLKKYTGEPFARKVEDYQANYDKNRENALPTSAMVGNVITPKSKKEERNGVFAAESESLQERCRVLLSIEIKNNQVKQSIENLIAEIEQNQELYLKSSLYNDIRKYYEKLQVKLGEFFFLSNNFQDALNCYRKADNYSELGYRDKIAAVERLIENEDIEKERRRIYKDINDFIFSFLESKNPTLENLYRTIEGIKSVRGLDTVLLEPSLSTRVVSFLLLPPRDELTINWLESYLSSRKKGKDNIITVLKKEFQKQLESKLERKLLNGGNSLVDVQAVLDIHGLYQEYFEQPIDRSDCLKKLEAYYRAKNDNNFPQMLELYREGQNILNFCGVDISSAWHIEDRKQVESQFLTYYYQQVEEVLGDGKLIRSKDDLQKFLKLDGQVRKYFKIGENESWKARSTCLNNYF